MRWVAASNYKPLYLGEGWQTQERSRQTPRESCHSCGFRQGIKPGEWNGPMCMLTIPFWTMSRCQESSGSLMDSAWHSAWTSKKEGRTESQSKPYFQESVCRWRRKETILCNPVVQISLGKVKTLEAPITYTTLHVCENTSHLLVWNMVLFSNMDLLQIIVQEWSSYFKIVIPTELA